MPLVTIKTAHAYIIINHLLLTPAYRARSKQSRHIVAVCAMPVLTLLQTHCQGFSLAYTVSTSDDRSAFQSSVLQYM